MQRLQHPDTAPLLAADMPEQCQSLPGGDVHHAVAAALDDDSRSSVFSGEPTSDEFNFESDTEAVGEKGTAAGGGSPFEDEMLLMKDSTQLLREGDLHPAVAAALDDDACSSIFSGESSSDECSTSPESDELFKTSKGAVADGTAPTWGESVSMVLPYILPNGRRYWILACCSVVAVCVEKGLGLAAPMMISRAVDVVTRGDRVVPVREIGSWFALEMTATAIAGARSYVTDFVRKDAERRFATIMFQRLQSLELAWHLDRHAGKTTRAVERGTTTISTLLNSFFFELVPTLLETCLVIFIFCRLGVPFIALSTGIASALFLGISGMMTAKQVAVHRRSIRARDQVSKKEVESLNQIETVATFGRQLSECVAYARMRTVLKRRTAKLVGLHEVTCVFQGMTRHVGIAAGLLLAAHGTVSATPPLSPGSFVVCFVYTEQLFWKLFWMARIVRTAAEALTDLEETTMILARRPGIMDGPSAEPLPKPGTEGVAMGSVSFENVCFDYPPRASENGHADRGRRTRGAGRRRGQVKGGNEDGKEEDVAGGSLSNISFSVPAGGRIALVGKSGAGKSTILRLLLRLYDCKSGTIRIDGHDIRTVKLESLREQIGVVAQETVLFSTSLRGNIAYGAPDASDAEVWEAVEAAALGGFVGRLPDGLCTRVGSRGTKLSGGERQRVGAARAALKKPRLLVLDESTSSLDSATEREVQRSMARVCRGRTSITVAHRLSTVVQADRILVVQGGGIVEQGTHGELVAREGGVYRGMWDTQTGAVSV
jgi:ATP-binding cassette, subfamily B, heavy metal transporter